MHIAIPEDYSGSMEGIDMEQFRYWDFGHRGCTLCEAGYKPKKRVHVPVIYMNTDIHLGMMGTSKDILDVLHGIEEIYNKKNRSRRLAKKLAKRFTESYNAGLI